MSNRQVQEEFVSQFGPEVKEKLFLVRRKAGKGTRKDAWMLTGTSYLASVDCGSGEPFGWHSIIVSLDADDTCTGIDLAG